MDSKKRLSTLIEPNKDSTIKIMDVRSINMDVPSYNFAAHHEEESLGSDDSSGSEKELVIDMPELEEVSADEEQPFPPIAKDLPVRGSTNHRGPTERINRRKSHHVLMEEDDAMYDIPGDDLSIESSNAPAMDDAVNETLKVNRNIMKHIALLQTSINYLMEKHYQQSFDFTADTSSSKTKTSWVQMYEQLKQDGAIGENSNAKMAKKN